MCSIDTDASDVGVGTVISQLQDGEERVIAYIGLTLTPPEKNYCMIRKELLAVIKAVKHFHPFLYGRHFMLRSDHGGQMVGDSNRV